MKNTGSQILEHSHGVVKVLKRQSIVSHAQTKMDWSVERKDKVQLSLGTVTLSLNTRARWAVSVPIDHQIRVLGGCVGPRHGVTFLTRETSFALDGKRTTVPP